MELVVLLVHIFGFRLAPFSGSLEFVGRRIDLALGSLDFALNCFTFVARRPHADRRV